MTTETSPSSFVQRFREYAAGGSLYPQTEGSPLLEFSAGGRVLYLLDRSGPYAVHPGPGRVLVSGALSGWELVSEHEERLSMTAVSALEGQGEVLHAETGTVVVRARLPLVLTGAAPLPVLGQWVRFATEAPLHGFLT